MPSSHPTATRPRPPEQQVTRPAISAGTAAADDPPPPPPPRPAAFSSKNSNLRHWYMPGRRGAAGSGAGEAARVGSGSAVDGGEQERKGGGGRAVGPERDTGLRNNFSGGTPLTVFHYFFKRKGRGSLNQCKFATVRFSSCRIRHISC